MSMFCNKCGNQLADGSVFCDKCGNKIANSSFCTKCGAELAGDASFCNKCGTKAGEMNVASNKPKEQIAIPTKCENCGGPLDFAPNKKSAICPFCNTEYIFDIDFSDDRIGNNLSNPINEKSIDINISTLLEEAARYEKENKYKKAKGDYEKVLELEPSSIVAKEGIERIEKIMEERIFFSYEHPNVFTKNECMDVKKDRLETYLEGETSKKVYYFDKIRNMKLTGLLDDTFEFDYPNVGRVKVDSGPCTQGQAIIEFINKVNKGTDPFEIAGLLKLV